MTGFRRKGAESRGRESDRDQAVFKMMDAEPFAGLVQSALTIGGARYQSDPLRVRHHFDGLIDEAMIYAAGLTRVIVDPMHPLTYKQ